MKRDAKGRFCKKEPLERKIEELKETIENMEKQEQAYRDGIDALQEEKAELESTTGALRKLPGKLLSAHELRAIKRRRKRV